jgi:hypothetical protein
MGLCGVASAQRQGNSEQAGQPLDAPSLCDEQRVASFTAEFAQQGQNRPATKPVQQVRALKLGMGAGRLKGCRAF